MQAQSTRGAWRLEEDKLLEESVERLGTESWAAIATEVPGRSAKSCRLRCAARVS
ncbi:MAG: hypothetical protein J3K34DRAFT_412692 [Monoraphidium minutum]|nr:MAG: hypothetical protein J3K34DRAFT_412692 [Monoraphidium minutum]